MRSVLGLMGADLEAPDHTTLSRRSRRLQVTLHRLPAAGPIDVIVDSTGLAIVGEGEWAAAKHGGHGRRGWKTIHLAVDRSGAILAQTLTDATTDDARTALPLLAAVEGKLASVTADAAYDDTVAVYEAAATRGATVVIPPTKTAKVTPRGPRAPARDRTITQVSQLGRRAWKKTSGYHQQARVENAFFRYKSILGDGLRARSLAGQKTETLVACIS